MASVVRIILSFLRLATLAHEWTLAAEIAGRKRKDGLDAKNSAAILSGMNTPRAILEYIGTDTAIAAALGVSPDRVDRARRGDKLPASWLDVLEQLARRPLPREAFSFKRADT
jgi:hypothetical protein